MNVKDIMVIGDSIATGYNASTKKNDGWSTMLGIPAKNNWAMNGTTAEEWSKNPDDDWWEEVFKRPKATLICSLAGNDMRKAAQDGIITIEEVTTAYKSLRMVAERARVFKRVVVMLYADPYLGTNLRTALGVALLNESIMMAWSDIADEFIHTSTMLNTKECFDGIDIHPTTYGHEKMAEHIGQQLDIDVEPSDLICR